MQPTRIDSLTSLRFFAAAMVVVFHASHSFGGLPEYLKHFTLTSAVSLFYVLSGFILSHTHRGTTSIREVLRFYTNRIARIWPLHLVTAFAALYMINWEGGHVAAPVIISNLLLVQSWYPNTDVYFSLNGVAWSLADEAFFYAMFPLLIYRIEKRWIFNLLATVIVTAAMLTAFRAAPRPWLVWAAYISPITRLSEFMLGIAAYQIYRRFGENTISLVKATMLELLMVALTVGALWATDLKFVSSMPFIVAKTQSIWASNCAAAIAFAPLIVVIAFQKGLLSNCLLWKPLVYLGEISFSLYMVHQLVQRFFDEHGLFTNYGLSMYWATAIACAAVAHHVVESPLRRLIIRTANGAARAVRT